MAESLVTNIIPDTALNDHDLPKINAKKGHVAIANRASGDLTIAVCSRVKHTLFPIPYSP